MDLLDVAPFEKAIASLEAALTRQAREPDDDLLRDGCIQRFEFTYELSHKTLKRFLVETSASPAEFDDIAFQDLIRTGSERGLLLGDWPRWKNYREARSLTSHTYDEPKARRVFELVPAFLEEAQFLRDRLRERLT